MGKDRLDSVNRVDHVGAGLALNCKDDRRLVVEPAMQRNVLGAGHSVADIPQPHRCAIAISDDQVVVFACRQKLVVGSKRIGLLLAVKHPLRLIDGGGT